MKMDMDAGGVKVFERLGDEQWAAGMSAIIFLVGL